MLALTVGGVALASTVSRDVPEVRPPSDIDRAYGLSQGFQPLELDDAELASTLDGIAATGVDLVRLDLSWPQIQPDAASDLQLTNTLRVYDAALARGLEVLPVTSGMPDWAGTQKPDSADSYEQFLRRAGEVLIPRGITAIEVLNEANLTGITPTDYTDLVLVPGAAGFRAAGAALGVPVTIVSTGLAPAETEGPTWSQVDFLAGVYAAGGGDSLDVVGVHPYTWPADPAAEYSWNWLKNTSQLHDVMTEHGDADKQIWATEFGYPTGLDARGIDEETQAEYLRRGAAEWASYPWAGTLVFYSYRDLTVRDDDPEHNFGVVRVDGSPKPGLQAVTEIVAG